MNKFFKISVMLSLFMGAISCAVEKDESAEDVEKRILESYIKVVHNDSLRPAESGIYTITIAKGNGDLIGDTSFVFATYSVRDLRGNYVSTTDEQVAKNVGVYSSANYYGPYLFQTGSQSIIRGLELGLVKKRVGGVYSFIIPSWLSDYGGYSSGSKAHTSPTIYDFKILRVVKSIEKFQRDSLRSYSNLYYGGIDSLKKDYYFKIIKATQGDSVKVGDNIDYYYIGKLLNGYVFDTNIEDTARKYGIYNSSKKYEPLNNTISDPEKSTDGGAGNTVIKGMGITFLKMKYGEKAVTFFSADYGYGSQEKNFGIYQPLFFEVEVVKKNK